MKLFSRKDRLLAGTVLAGTSFFGMAGMAYAQTAPAAGEKDDVVIVTGTRIANANLTSPTAITTVGEEQIELSGEANLVDILQGVPSFGQPGLSSGNSNFLTTGNGVNTLQLRNLGENRTLTLVNGRRYVPGLPGSSFVDFNTIPVDLLERVEVITGGASAIYGADALAGVINVILKDDFEGFEARYQYGQTEHDDDIDQRFSLLAGGNFADGRGNAVVNFVYSRNDGVLAKDRANTAFDDTNGCNGVDPNTCKNSVGPAFSGFGAGGRFFNENTFAPYAYNIVTGATTPFSTPVNGFNRQAFRRYTTPIQRYQISGLFHYDLADNVTAFAETMYTNAHTSSDIEPTPFHHSSAGILGIPCSNPFVPTSLFNTVCSAGQENIPFNRRMVELGGRGTSSDRNSFRVVTGLRGDLGEDTHWEVFASHGRTDLAQTNGGVVNTTNFRNAVIGVVDNGDGTFSCGDAIAIAQGCVPVNIFGAGSITPAMAAYIGAPTSRAGFTQIESAGATLNGNVPIFTLPAGPISYAVGTEWRREAAGDFPDALTQSGQTSSNQEKSTEGSYHVAEVFGELEVPILADMPFVKDLSAGFAYRYSDYSTLGGTDSYSGRLQWAVNDALSFRGQVARAVRVPNISELFSPAGENFAPVSDPCNGVTATTPGNIAINCRANPLIAARIADQGVFALTLAETQGTGGFSGGGNPALEAEEADSYNLGAVWTQDFGGGLGRWMASVDWWRIEIGNQIATLGRQATVDACYDVDPAAFPAVECNFLVRDNVGPPSAIGALKEVNSTFQNFDDVSFYEGVDFAVSWNVGLDEIVATVPGDLSLRLNWTHAISDNATERGAMGGVGQADVGTPRDKVLFGAVYSNGPLQFSWETSYLGDMIASAARSGRFAYDLGSYTVHDLRLGWNLNDQTNLYVGANNAFDEDAPIVLSGVSGNTTGTDTNASFYDPIGRSFYAGVRLRY